jgi:hypothetical protein
LRSITPVSEATGPEATPPSSFVAIQCALTKVVPVRKQLHKHSIIQSRVGKTMHVPEAVASSPVCVTSSSSLKLQRRNCTPPEFMHPQGAASEADTCISSQRTGENRNKINKQSDLLNSLKAVIPHRRCTAGFARCVR